ncbi:histone H2B-like [Ambystoma mexicanum]|uniref:histone H2B-like n=1 Tax=Ambystoma mexicanum TaxID=8296 RepID=UPI0037E872DB
MVKHKETTKNVITSVLLWKMKGKNKENYSNYIYKVVKQVHPDLHLSLCAMRILNSINADLFVQVASEVSSLALNNKRSTITCREIQTAVKLLLPGDIIKHTVSEGTKTVAKYASFQWQTPVVPLSNLGRTNILKKITEAI